MAVDPITLAVLQGSLEQIADEMDVTLERMAFSPVISDGWDRASGIYHPDNGEVIIQGPRGLPNFIYVMEFTVRSVIEWVTDIAPGDVYIVNDPYLGGTHLMDVKMVKPFFYRGQLDRLPGDEWTLAGHRRTGPRRLLHPGNRGLPGRAASASGADHGSGPAQSGRARHHPAERARGHRTAG